MTLPNEERKMGGKDASHEFGELVLLVNVNLHQYCLSE